MRTAKCPACGCADRNTALDAGLTGFVCGYVEKRWTKALMSECKVKKAERIAANPPPPKAAPLVTPARDPRAKALDIEVPF